VSQRLVSGGVLGVLGVLALWEARRLSALREEMVAGAVVGDDTFPLIVGVGLLLLAGYLVLLARWPEAHVTFPGGRQRRQVLWSGAALVGYYLLTPHLGYTLATLATASLLYRAMGGYRWRVALLLAGITTGALYLMFRVWLLQPLPTGRWGI
jgi:hypothetical protein